MNERLSNIEKEVIDELKKRFENAGSTSGLIIQIGTIAAQVTKSFLEKYEKEITK
ncbi:hypothetical protein [Bacillus sp. JJ1474]|uniref:hypothetical protein n=1 Tax=Bacillus sp. JJ1474 TaxID=3122955 RepID=UPI00300073DF